MDNRPFKKEEEEEEDTETESDDGDGDGDGVEEEEVGVTRKRVMIRVYSGHQRSVVSLASCSSSSLCCQADECGMDLTVAKTYHRRHKVCDRHAKAPVVLVSGIRQRFCQQCSRFHEISQFDDTKRSCRERLAGHNERRRKTHPDQQAEDGKPAMPKMSSSSLEVTKHPKYGEMTFQGSPNTKHFRI